MTTRESIYKTALEHIRDGSDVVCFDCGWMGNQAGLTYENAPLGVRKVCPDCGNLPLTSSPA